MTEDYCKIWYSEDPYDVGGSTTPATGVQVISGRSRVHAFWVMNRWVDSSTSYTLTRPMSLLDAASGNELYKSAFMNPVGGTDSGSSKPLANYSHYFGGDGILFPDGVWFGVDATDQSGSSSASSKTAMYVAIVYTGGVNT
tara:strand:+ start:5892 stop:6314 length:423 start_codon:yes stop_codon:yes gene_type:complete